MMCEPTQMFAIVTDILFIWTVNSVTLKINYLNHILCHFVMTSLSCCNMISNWDYNFGNKKNLGPWFHFQKVLCHSKNSWELHARQWTAKNQANVTERTRKHYQVQNIWRSFFKNDVRNRFAIGTDGRNSELKDLRKKCLFCMNENVTKINLPIYKEKYFHLILVRFRPEKVGCTVLSLLN